MIETVIFDLGGVLIDWNPRYLFKKVFNSDKEMHYFLEYICNEEWNHKHDAGRPFEEGVSELKLLFPEYESYIEMYYQRWEEMLGGEISESVKILRDCIEDPGLKVIALTNWSAQTFPIAKEKYSFLDWFDDIIVSGEIQLAKPDSQIFIHTIGRHNLVPRTSLFIDDRLENVESARQLGFQVIHYRSSEQLRVDLTHKGVLD